MLPELHDARFPQSGAVLIAPPHAFICDRYGMSAYPVSPPAPLISESLLRVCDWGPAAQTEPDRALTKALGSSKHVQQTIIDAHHEGLNASIIAEIPEVREYGYTGVAVRGVIYRLRKAGILSRAGIRPQRRIEATEEERRLITKAREQGASRQQVADMPEFAHLRLKPDHVSQIQHHDVRKLRKRKAARMAARAFERQAPPT